MKHVQKVLAATSIAGFLMAAATLVTVEAQTTNQAARGHPTLPEVIANRKSFGSDVPARHICPLPGSDIRADSFYSLKDEIAAAAGEEMKLRAIERVLQKAETVCGRGRLKQNLAYLANLWADVAKQWHEIKAFSYANGAYQRAYDLRPWEEPVTWRIWLLQNWASMKLDSGDSWGARDLADRQVTLAEDNLRRRIPSSVDKNTMISALRSQEEVYRLIGLAHKADAIRRRADELETALK